MELAQPTVAATLAVVVMLLIDKVIVPLIKGKTRDSSKHQEYVNEQFDRRITELENGNAELRETMSGVRTSVEVSQAILERLEDR